MTRKEANFILANIDRRVCDDELNEALDMAIEALEQKPQFIRDLNEIYTALWKVDIPNPTIPEYVEHHEQIQGIMALVDELIGKWGSGMTREIALHCMKSASELERELCEECPIYGQTGSDHCFEDALQYVIGMLEQESKTGHWIDEFGGCECSECGCLEGGYSDYCPNCGAKMEANE